MGLCQSAGNVRWQTVLRKLDKGATALKIIVCLKQTLDPEVPPKDFKIDPASKQPVRGNAKLVVDSYSENALEVAIQLKEKLGAEVTAITVGDKPADEVLRRALALTADQAVRAWDPAWANLDAHAVAHVLARAIAHLGGADLILTGREAADIERGHVGPMLAQELGFACATLVGRVEIAGAEATVRREVEGGFEVVQAKLPAVVTITSDETNVPRLPKVKDTMMAMRKPITVLGSGEIGVDASLLAPRLELLDVYVPASEGECEIIEADDAAGKAVALVQRLRERKVL